MRRKDKGTVTIISRESDSKTIDVAMLEAELKRRGIETRTMCRLLTKDKSVAKSLGYIGHVIRQEAAILRSDVVVLDTYCIPASMLPHRPGTKVIQMWHALSAVKKFGWQTVGMEDGSSERTARLMKMHQGYDYVVCASDITAEHFREAFRVGPDKIAKYGLPRIDYIKSISGGSRRDDLRRRIASAYHAIGEAGEAGEAGESGRKTILYVPTFRRHRPGQDVEAAERLIRAINERYPYEYNIVVKLHPLYRGSDMGTATGTGTGSESKPGLGTVSGAELGSTGSGSRTPHPNAIYDEIFSSFEWLSSADIIISDYSSLVVESALADKPLYLYTYDIDDYEKSTGLNVDFSSEPVAPYAFKDADALAEALARPYDMDRLAAFRGRYIDIDTGDAGEEGYCTSKLAGFIESLMQQ